MILFWIYFALVFILALILAGLGKPINLPMWLFLGGVVVFIGVLIYNKVKVKNMSDKNIKGNGGKRRL